MLDAACLTASSEGSNFARRGGAGLWATNDRIVSEFILTVYFPPASNSEPKGTIVSTIWIVGRAGYGRVGDLMVSDGYACCA